MNGRALLLLLLCLGFVGIWNQDSAWQPAAKRRVAEPAGCQCQDAAMQDQSERFEVIRQELSASDVTERWRQFGTLLVAVSRELNRLQVEEPIDARPAAVQTVSVHAVAVAQPQQMPQSTPLQANSIADEVCLSATEIPLPSGIAPGRYHVVNNRGMAISLLISDCDLAYRGVTAVLPARDFYVAQDDRERWFFIRQLDEQPVLVQSLDAVSTPQADVQADHLGTEGLTQVDWQAVSEQLVRAGRKALQRRIVAFEKTRLRIDRVRDETVVWLALVRLQSGRLATDLGRWVETAETAKTPLTVTEGVKSDQTL